MAESPRMVDGLGLEELKSLLVQALEEIARLKAQNADLRDGIARLKGLKGWPQIEPSGMEKATQPEAAAKGHRRIGRRGPKRAKLTITETKVVECESIPAGARFKGYEEFVVQDLIVQAKTVLYRRERWLSATGKTIVAPLPAGISSHFGPELKRFVLAQYHQGQTTIPRLLALLADLGVSVSKRQLVRMLIEGQDAFLDEARDVLRTGLDTAPWITADDTGARHKAKNGVCTQIGNDQFTSFITTGSKSRLNFLELLNAGNTTHLINDAGLAYSHVTRRKVSGGTRSDEGRDCRDAFLGLMKTCAKQTIRFWDYLGARLGVPGAVSVPPLPDLIRSGSSPLAVPQQAATRRPAAALPGLLPLLLNATLSP